MTLETPPDLSRLVVAECPLIRLRHKHPSDALNDFQWRRDPEVARFDGGPLVTAPFSEFLHKLEYDIRYPSSDRLTFAIESAGGDHIGNIMYYRADHAAQTAEFGISIGPESWRGRGAGTAATILFLRHIWAALPFRLIHLHTLEWNERAQRCFHRAGFDEVARVVRNEQSFIRMEARREWWLLWDMEGRFDGYLGGNETPGKP
ncbi:MAG: GNAT family N-acetyltransferase [Chloroflexi bacterium]|nr:GNAT family N-acetyltransferase [Chloroflexota bacterium]